MVYKFDKNMMWEIFNKSHFPNMAFHYFDLSQMDSFFDQFIARKKRDNEACQQRSKQ
jgi:hypothetical protein